MTSLPSLAEIRTLPPFTEGEVPEEFIDENGHMNIGDYFRLASWAVWMRMQDVGSGPGYIEERGLSFFTVEHRLRYLGELRLGRRYSVRAGFVERTGKTVHGAAYVVDEEADRVACVMEAVYVHVSMEDRRSTPIPDDVAAGLDEAIAQTAGWLPAAADGLSLRR